MNVPVIELIHVSLACLLVAEGLLASLTSRPVVVSLHMSLEVILVPEDCFTDLTFVHVDSMGVARDKIRPSDR